MRCNILCGFTKPAPGQKQEGVAVKVRPGLDYRSNLLQYSMLSCELDEVTFQGPHDEDAKR